MKSLIKRRYLLQVALVTIASILMVGCVNKTKTQNDEIVYKTIENERFGFLVKIPSDWIVVDNSSNGDGYYIQTDNQETDLRVFAQYVVEEAEDDYCSFIEDFAFIDDSIGKICHVNETEFYIYRMNNNVKVVLYVKSTKEWLNKHEQEINVMAKSIQFLRKAIANN